MQVHQHPILGKLMKSCKPYELFCREGGKSQKKVFATYSCPDQRRRAYMRLVKQTIHTVERRIFVDPLDQEQRDRYHAVMRGLGA